MGIRDPIQGGWTRSIWWPFVAGFVNSSTPRPNSFEGVFAGTNCVA